MRPARPEESPESTNARQSPHWQAELARGYRDPAELLRALSLTPDACGLAASGVLAFPLRVPRGFVARMRPGDPRDPLLLQVLPASRETEAAPGFIADPVGDLASARSPGLLQKYAGRALLITTGACAVHCRYCFRREYPYAGASAAGDHLEQALQSIADDPSLREVILSGGDPLVLGEQRLEFLLGFLDNVPHVERVRIHTRVPVVLPERVDARLLDLLDRQRQRVVVVVHANHPREIDTKVATAFRSLGEVTAALLNQSVLLRGINDAPEVLADLSSALFAAGVLPYYLHQLDPVSGAAHFAVTDEQAVAILRTVTALLPGYLVPRLARETAGASAKTLLGPFGAT
ncbi:MAG: EF-P beta-lysylation protein EpmB [Gammaproteobacteria bacterium]